MNVKRSFSVRSTNFLAQVLTFLFGTLAMVGAKFPGVAEAVAQEVSNTILSGGGVWAIGAVLIVNVINPLYHLFVKKKPTKGTWLAMLGSPNFIITAFSLVASAVLLVGISIPAGTGEQVVAAIFAKDWTALAIIVFSNVLSPIVRFFRDRNKIASGVIG